MKTRKLPSRRQLAVGSVITLGGVVAAKGLAAYLSAVFMETPPSTPSPTVATGRDDGQDHYLYERDRNDLLHGRYVPRTAPLMGQFLGDSSQHGTNSPSAFGRAR